MKGYLVFDVGCIECGEDSSAVGLYHSEQEAQDAIDGYLDPNHSWGRDGWFGQHSVEIFEVDIPAWVNNDGA